MSLFFIWYHSCYSYLTCKCMRGYHSSIKTIHFLGNQYEVGGMERHFQGLLYFSISKYIWWEESSNKIGNNDQKANKRLHCWKYLLRSNRFATTKLVTTYQKDEINSRHTYKCQMMGSGMITCHVAVCNLLCFEAFDIWLAKKLLKIAFFCVCVFLAVQPTAQ